MRKSLLTTGLAAVAVLTLAGCSSSTPDGTAGEETEWPSSITLSLVPSVEGEDLAQALDPLTSYLSENLGIEVEGVVASDYAATVEALGTDQAQVIITDAGSLYNAVERYDAELILRDVRFGATSYSAVAYTNNPDKYCDDDPVMSTYAASGIELSSCNGIEEAGAESTGSGPAGVEALSEITDGTKVALQSATSPAGYQYPVVAMREQGVDTDNGITQVPVEGNNNAVLAVYNGDAEVSFGYWDARTTVAEEAADIAERRALREMRGHIGMIFQGFNLADRANVYRNVLVGRFAHTATWRTLFGVTSARDRELALRALDSVGMLEKVWNRAGQLSGGQKQRVAIARALTQQPSVMLADEPVASLDPPTAHAVMHDLRRVNRDDQLTVLVNIHLMDLARQYTTRMIGLRAGEVVYDGPAADATDHDFEQIYGRPIQPRDVMGA